MDNFKNESKEEALKNWTKWLQVRIPELNKGANEFWVRQALEGFNTQMKLKNKTK